MGNNRDLPKYEKSVAIQPTQMVDAESSANAMINAFQNFSSSVAQVSQKISKDEADARRETIKNNISNTYKGFALEALRNPDKNAALVDYQKKSDQYRQGMMETSDHYNKPYVGNLVDYYSNEHQYAIEKDAIMQNKRIESVAAYERINNAVNDITNAINNSHPYVDENGRDAQFDIPKALLANTLKNMERDAVNGSIDPENMRGRAKEITKKAVEDMFLKRYQDHVEVGKGDEYINELRDPKYHIENFDEQDKNNLIGKMMNIRARGASMAHVQLGQLNRMIHDEILRVSDGGMPNLDLQDTVKKLDEQKYLELKDKTSIAQGVSSAKQAAFYATPSQIAKLKAGYLNIDPKDPEYGQKKRIADAQIKAIDLQTKEFQQDPMRQILKDPAIQEAVTNYENATNVDAVGNPGLMNTPTNSTVPNPYPSIMEAQMRKGLTINGTGAKGGGAGTRVRPIQNGDVSGMVSDIMMASPKDKIAIMNNWNKKFGGGLAFNAAVKQLVDGGMPSTYTLLKDLDPNSKDAMDVAEAIDTNQTELVKTLETREKGLPKEIATRSAGDTFGLSTPGFFSTLFGGSDTPTVGGTKNFQSFMATTSRHAGQVDMDYYKEINKEVVTLANYYALHENLGADQAVAKAQDVIASRYDYTTIGNSDIRIPHDTTSDIVTSYAEKVTPEVNTFGWNFKGYNKDAAMRLIQDGHWKNDSADVGLVWVDTNGKLWTDSNGHPLSFSFGEAKTGVRNKHMDSPDTKTNESLVKQLNNVTPAATEGVIANNSDDQLDEIDRRGAEMMKRGKKMGTKVHELLTQANQGKL